MVEKKPKYYAYVPDKWNSEKPDPKLFVVADTPLEIKMKGCKLAHEQHADVEVWSQTRAVGDIKRTKGDSCQYNSRKSVRIKVR